MQFLWDIQYCIFYQEFERTSANILKCLCIETYFNQTCCKEIGVPEECMGYCISPRILKGNHLGDDMVHDYSEHQESFTTLCDGMNELIEQCVVDPAKASKRKHKIQNTVQKSKGAG